MDNTHRMAKYVQSFGGAKDSLKLLKRFGFTSIRVFDSNYYEALLPQGWSTFGDSDHNGDYFYFRDKNQKVQITQIYTEGVELIKGYRKPLAKKFVVYFKHLLFK